MVSQFVAMKSWPEIGRRPSVSNHGMDWLTKPTCVFTSANGQPNRVLLEALFPQHSHSMEAWFLIGPPCGESRYRARPGRPSGVARRLVPRCGGSDWWRRSIPDGWNIHHHIHYHSVWYIILFLYIYIVTQHIDIIRYVFIYSVNYSHRFVHC